MEAKKCAKCKRCLPVNEFHRQTAEKDGLRSSCKQCVAPYQAAYRAAYRDSGKQREYVKANQPKRTEYQRRRRAEKPEEYHLSMKTGYAKEKERRQNDPLYYEEIKAKKRLYQRDYRQGKGKVKVKDLRRARRARQKAAPGRFTQGEFQEVCAKYGFLCLRCGSAENLVPDHVVALSKGGSNFIENIQPLCHSCNCSKKDKATDYRPAMGGM